MLTEMEASLFTGLGADERRALEARLRPRHFAPGAIILQQGQWSRTLHIVRRGGATVTVADSFGERREVARLAPGEIVGEMAVLTGRPHSATVTATGATETLALAHDDFLTLLEDSPRLAQNVLRILSERLSRTSRRQLADERATLVGALVPGDEAAAPIVALNLAVSLARQSRRRVLLVVDEGALGGPLRPLRAAALPSLARVAGDPAALAAHRSARGSHPALLGVRLCAAGDGTGPVVLGDVQAAVRAMGATYDYIVLGAPLVGAGAGLAIRQVRALVFAPGGRLAEAARAPASAAWAAAGAAIGLVATGLPAQPTLGELQSLGGQAGFPVLRGLPVSHEAFAADPLPPLVRRAPRGPVARAIDWLARDVAGLRVGLALGAGSARGFAHIGVLKALEREGVPIDALAGTSVGAFVGAFWSCGLGAEGAADALERAGRRPFGLAVQRSALFSNRWIGASLRGVVGERRFEDLPHPFAAVAVDLVTGDPVALHRGPLWRAVLASGTIPGVYPPVADEGRLLVDGVVRMPVPTGVAADLGGDVTIGVRLAPRREDAVASAGTPGPEQRNIVGVVLTILDVMQEAIEAHGTARADLLIHPEVTKVTLRHFAEGRALVAAGEVAAEEALPALRRLLPWLGDARPE